MPGVPRLYSSGIASCGADMRELEQMAREGTEEGTERARLGARHARGNVLLTRGSCSGDQ